MTSRAQRLLCLPVLAAIVAFSLATSGAAAGGGPANTGDPTPALAYYYIWFQPSSWNRAKTDYPSLGRYSSDERSIMRTHIRWAKASGLNGFIVSWKGTAVLNERLEKLIEIAREERFKLAVIYQGLDFERRPLPASKIARDMDYFTSRFARAEPFKIYDKPLMIWSGTWRFSRAEIAGVTSSRRDKLQILATEKNEAEYRAKADLVDGDAYYWSSVNPDTFPGYEDKLQGMSAAVHQRSGLWIAPAAPGFDARLIGGKTVVPRNGGDTLRRQMSAAAKSSPDAIGVISWNEFSENSHIEPSAEHGGAYLRTLADIRGTHPPDLGELDSSSPGATGQINTFPLLGGLAILGLIGLKALSRRRSGVRSNAQPLPGDDPG